jgi:hypothetical protein
MNKRASVKEGALGDYLKEVDELPPGSLIGHLVMFTIMDTPIERDWLVKQFDDLGLDQSRLPPPVVALDAFKKATSSAKDRYTLEPSGNTVQVMCRERKSDKNRVIRQITVEVRDASGENELSYSKGIECTFFRPRRDAANHQINQKSARALFQVVEDGKPPLDEEGKARLHKISDEIEARFEHHAHYLDGDKIRAVVRNYLRHQINAIELRGGTYFVPDTHVDELIRLRTLVERIENGCNMIDFALPALSRHRELIVEAFQKDAADKLAQIVSDIADLRDTRKNITPAAYSKVKERYDTVMSQAEEYLTRLELNQDVTAAHAEIALASLEALQEDMVKED